MPTFKRTPPQDLLDVLERVEKLRPKWNVVRGDWRSPDIFRLYPISLVKIWCESHGIRVDVDEQLCYLNVYGLWRGFHFVEARRFTVDVMAWADDRTTWAPIYGGRFMDKEEQTTDAVGKKERTSDNNDIDVAACDFLHQYIYRVATPIFQAENAQREEYEAKMAAEIRARQDKGDAIKANFWKT